MIIVFYISQHCFFRVDTIQIKCLGDLMNDKLNTTSSSRIATLSSHKGARGDLFDGFENKGAPER